MRSPSTLYGTWQGDKFIPNPEPKQDQPGTQPQQEKKKDQLLIQLDPPSQEELFQLRSERGLYDKMVDEWRVREGKPNETPNFPPTGILAEPGRFYVKAQMPAASAEVVPSFLCHQPLYFEEKNSERYGWEMGIWQPFISAGTFYKDLAFPPYKMGLDHPLVCVTNVGKWQPGDCVPYILYVTPFTWKGAALEAGTIIGGGAIWP